MTGREIFNIWAPYGVKWTDWAKPVPFVAIDSVLPHYDCANLTVAENFYLREMPQNTAVIIDLPGCEGIREGLALAKLGFRPVPLYNGTNGQQGATAVIDNNPVISALIWGASVLPEIPLPDDAPPVFLLDSNRLHRHKMDVSVFDNSWDVYEQDLPSAEYFIKSGIKKIIVHGKKVNKDLARILYKFQKKGIAISLTDGYSEPIAVKVRKPLF